MPAPGKLQYEQVAFVGPDGTLLPAPSPADIATPAGDGSATCADNLSIAVLGPLTRDAREIGGPIRDGAALAVQEFNAANPGCQLTLKEFDSQGSQTVVADRAADIIADNSVIGIVGPSFSLEVKQTGDTFAAANLLMASPSATDPELSGMGWTNFFRGLPTGVDGSTAAGHFLAEGLDASKVCVVHLDHPEMAAQASLVTQASGPAAVADCSGVAHSDFSSTVSAVRSAGADAVYFSADVPASSDLATALRDAGIDSEFMVSDFPTRRSSSRPVDPTSKARCWPTPVSGQPANSPIASRRPWAGCPDSSPSLPMNLRRS